MIVNNNKQTAVSPWKSNAISEKTIPEQCFIYTGLKIRNAREEEVYYGATGLYRWSPRLGNIRPHRVDILAAHSFFGGKKRAICKFSKAFIQTDFIGEFPADEFYKMVNEDDA